MFTVVIIDGDDTIIESHDSESEAIFAATEWRTCFPFAIVVLCSA